MWTNEGSLSLLRLAVETVTDMLREDGTVSLSTHYGCSAPWLPETVSLPERLGDIGG